MDFDLRTPDLSEVPPEQRGASLVRHFIRRWEGDLSDNALPILLRCALTNEAAAERLKALFIEQIVPFVTMGTRAEDARESAALIASQMLGLAICRYVLQLRPLLAIDTERLVAWIAPTIQRYLGEVRDEAPSSNASSRVVSRKPSSRPRSSPKPSLVHPTATAGRKPR